MALAFCRRFVLLARLPKWLSNIACSAFFRCVPTSSPSVLHTAFNAVLTCFRGGPPGPPTQSSPDHVGALLALLFGLGRLLSAFCVLAAFVLVSGRFFCILERSTVDFGGVKDAPGRVLEAPTAYFSKFFHAFACTRAGGAQKLLMCKNHSFSQVFPRF